MKSFQETLARFSRTKVRPRAAAVEAAGQVPAEIIQELWQLGSNRCQFPESYGGLGDPSECLPASMLAAGEIARGCAGIALAASGPGPIVSLLLRVGTEAQKQALLPGFALNPPLIAGYSLGQGLFPPDFSRVEVEAWPEEAGYILQGRQSWVVNYNSADWYLLPARVGSDRAELGWFLIRKNSAGLEVKDRLSTLGLAAVAFGNLVLSECRVPPEARIGEPGAEPKIQAAWVRTGLVWAAIAAGIIEASLEYALAYAEDRVQFGAPIAEREAIGLMLTEMKLDLELGRSLLWRAAGEIESRPEAVESGVLALAHLGPAAVKHAANAVQILGGYGFIRDYPCEKWLRDAKTLEVLLGGAERQKLWLMERMRRPRKGSAHG